MSKTLTLKIEQPIYQATVSLNLLVLLVRVADALRLIPVKIVPIPRTYDGSTVDSTMLHIRIELPTIT